MDKKFYQNTPLHGEALEEFIIWYEREYRNMHVHAVCYWDELPFSMQYGVYLEFFLFHGIKLELEEFTRDGRTMGYQPVVNYEINVDPQPYHLAVVELIREGGEKLNQLIEDLNEKWEELRDSGLGEKLRGEW